MKSTPENRLELGTAIRASYHILKAVEQFHNLGFIHRDIKPGNILIREGPEFPLALVDYGLSKVYLNPRTGRPKAERSSCGFRGTRLYASVNALRSHHLSRRDDIVSWLYLTIELVNGTLPWHDVIVKDEMIRVREMVSIDDLVRSTMPELIGIWTEINSLAFNDQPNYASYYDRLTRLMQRIGVALDDKYQWSEMLHVHRQRVVQLLDQDIRVEVDAHALVEISPLKQGLLGPLITAPAPFSTVKRRTCPCLLL